MKPRLDDAIDHVAARLTQVDDDPMLASRIVNALPDRVNWLGWLFHSWPPRLAVLAIIVSAGMLWNKTRVTPTEPALLQVTATAPVVATVRASIEPKLSRTKPPELLEPLEQMALPKVDFDRSLAAIAAPAALGVGSLSPGDLPAGDTLTIAPLEIADLPLTGESFAPR